MEQKRSSGGPLLLFPLTRRMEGRGYCVSAQLDVCVPLRADKAPAEAVVLPECRALSVLYYGEYGGIDEAWLTLGREVKARGLKPNAPPRVLGIVAPYTGREINAQRYCSRLVLPVEEE